MSQTTLFIGACRSGKSREALKTGEKIPGPKKIFLATCVAQDTEMAQRVERHQIERGSRWRTIEEPIDLDQAINKVGRSADVILVDCLTLWMTNLILANDQDEQVVQAVEKLCNVIAAPPCPLIFVTNEVGAGIVPADPLSRRFRDLMGWANQKTAAACRQVIWMVAGITVPVKTGDGPGEGAQE